MKRDQSMDVALRDIDYLRERGRSKANSGHIIMSAAIGACSAIDGSCSDAGQAPTCPDYSMDYICANFAQVIVVVRALAGGGVTTVTLNPLDSVFCPMAVSSSFWDDADVTLKRTSWVFNVNVRGCLQLDFQNPADTVAGATGFIDTQTEWDPTFKNSCKACPVDWSCFTNNGMGTAQMQMVLGNPHAAPISGKFSIWGIPYTCCPGFSSLEDIRNGRKPERGVPPGPPKPLGTAKRASPFA